MRHFLPFVFAALMCAGPASGSSMCNDLLKSISNKNESSEEITIEDALAFLKGKFPGVPPDTLEKYLEIEPSQIKGYYQISQVHEGDYKDVFIVKKKDEDIVSFFDEVAEEISSNKLILVVRDAALQKIPVLIEESLEESYAFEILDKKMVSETVRVMRGYSRSLLLSTFFSSSTNPKVDKSRFGRAYLLETDPNVKGSYKLIPTESTVKLASFVARSPEVFDGSAVTFLKNPDQIAMNVHATPEETVKLMRWGGLAESLLTEAGEALINVGSLPCGIPMGPVGKQLKITYP